ncbi:hypothetical protein [Paenibacillus roseipurpureus]|uniref:Uncharacterized protein n=1 Tax=Paenibacillus roseopurpureus TaxID=2918901 RepID=A0AA96RL36_9BACL|nr:hypothetical protein [Paenibacillus sp. MBLB1832]WNR42712.1 hypothetical protein MJB10_16480 [Paenibacillus sp. MBLB1832]
MYHAFRSWIIQLQLSDAGKPTSSTLDFPASGGWDAGNPTILRDIA